MRGVNTGNYGTVEVSTPYPLLKDPTVPQPDPRMTPLLALMGLHLLAAADDHWSIPYNCSHPRLGTQGSAR